MACSINLNEFRFLISRRVPNLSVPLGFIDTLISHLKLPSCILPSQIPIHCTSSCNFFAYATASAAEVISGSDTISKSGVPARFKSMPVPFSTTPCVDFPASSSKWARVIRTVFLISPTSISSNPLPTTGNSY